MSKPSTQTIETVKTVVIAVLITGIVAFIGGMQYQSRVNDQVKAASVVAPAPKQ